MIEAATSALVFPGQGSQEVGMGNALFEAFAVARETFDEADELLGFKLSSLCFQGPDEELTATVNAQPALYTAGVAAWRVLLIQFGGEFRPAFTAGHSLGEFTALTAAGALEFAEGLQLVRRRGELMRDAGEISPGGMLAVLGLDIEQAQALCAEVADETGGVLLVANDNCPGQVVIAGDEAALERAESVAKEKGARRVVRVQISIAAHTPLMEYAASNFREALSDTNIKKPNTPVMANVSASPLTEVEAIRAELDAQLTSSVRWTESVRGMLEAGVSSFLELGSKSVLTGLLRRIDRSATGIVLDAPEGFEGLEIS